MNKVRSISIKGYKSIRNLEEFLLTDLNVLVGPNGAGKSNFVSIFKLLNEIVEERLQTHIQKNGGAHTFLYYGPKVTSSVELKFDFSPNSYYCKLSPTGDDSLIFEDEYYTYQGNRADGTPYDSPLRKSALVGDRRESGLNRATGYIKSYVVNSIKSWQIYHFHDTSNTAGIKQIGKIDDNRRLRPDGSNLGAYLFLLKNRYQQEYQMIVRAIKLVAPFFGDFNLHPLERSTDSIKLEWRHKDSDAYFDASSLSDGTLRFMCLTTLLMQPARMLPTTVLLDEPELGLHPHAITILAKMLNSTSKKTQIIVSTQSTTLINQLKPENLIVVDRDNDQSTFRRLTAEETTHWMDEFGLGDLWEKNLFGGTP